MNNQQQAAKESMTAWLSHEQELGRKPYRIEPAGEFTLHEMTYYLFKYKKGLLGGWLLGVCGGYESADSTEHCGHVFSEMKAYNPATAVEEASGMIEMIRQHWMRRAAELESAPAGDRGPGAGQEGGSKGLFNGFVLLNTVEFDRERVKMQLMQDWNIPCLEQVKEEAGDEADDEPHPIVFEAEGSMLAVSFIPVPVPDGEAVRNAGSNYMWPDAEETVKTHVAQLIVAVILKIKLD